MCMFSSQTSPSRTRANDSEREARPARSDFTSEPVNTMPASSRSVISKSKRARRLVATVFWPSSRGLTTIASDVEEASHRGEARHDGDECAGSDQPRVRRDDVAVPDQRHEADLPPKRVDERHLEDE